MNTRRTFFTHAFFFLCSFFCTVDAHAVKNTLKKTGRYLIAGGYLLPIGLLKCSSLFSPETFAHIFKEKDLTQEEIQQARTIIRQVGLDPENITLIGTNQLPACFIGTNHIAINPDACTQEEFRFNLGHECMHLKHHDPIKMGLSPFLAPVITHYGLRIYDHFFQRLLTVMQQSLSSKRRRIHRIIKTVKKIHQWLALFCVTKGIVSLLLWVAYNRYMEKQADIAAATQLKCAKAGAAFFQRVFEQKNQSLLSLLFHPLPQERVRYLNKIAGKQ